VFLVSISLFPFLSSYAISSASRPQSQFLYVLPFDTRLPALRLFDHSVSQIPACLCSQPLSCIQCIRISLMGMLGGFYVTSRASRCASTPAFSSCVRFRITSVLGNVCSQFKIHSRLCFGSMSCHGFQFFGFPCLRFSSSLLSRFSVRFRLFQSVFQSVLSSLVSDPVQNLLELFSPRFSVFGLQCCSVSVSVLSLDSSISYSNSGSSLSFRYSVKVVHVFVPSNSGSSLFRLLQFKGCPRLWFSSSCRIFVKVALVRRKSVSLRSSTPRSRTQIPVRLCPCTV
jgi:hypothetical protein